MRVQERERKPIFADSRAMESYCFEFIPVRVVKLEDSQTANSYVCSWLISVFKMKVSQSCPSLRSEVIGEYDETHGIACFRGIPYATVKKRWTHSQIDHSLTSPFDATKFGPRCVQEEGEVLVSGGTNDPTPGDDEFTCLNLNIAIPEECLQQLENGNARTKIPVMFWIHG